MIEQPLSPNANMQKPLTFGQRLISSRETLGLNRKEAASQLRLPERIIVMLETDEIEPALPLTFLRGYIRNYSKFLALPEEEVQAALDTLAPPSVTSTEVYTVSQKPSLRRANFFLGVFKYFIGLALIVLVGVSLFTYKTNSFPHVSVVQTAEPLSSTPVPLEEASLNTGLPAAQPAFYPFISQAKSWIPSLGEGRKILAMALVTVIIALCVFLLIQYIFSRTKNRTHRSQQNLFIQHSGILATIARVLINKWIMLGIAIVLAGVLFLRLNHTSLMHGRMPILSRQASTELMRVEEHTVSPLPLQVQLAAGYKTYALAALINQLNSYLAAAAKMKFTLTEPPTTELTQLSYRRHRHGYHAHRDYGNTIPPYYRYDHPEM